MKISIKFELFKCLKQKTTAKNINENKWSCENYL